jgi:uridine phosphorylase
MMQIFKEAIAPRVIVCGDQARALLFSLLLDKESIVFKSSNLDYDTYTGTQ